MSGEQLAAIAAEARRCGMWITGHVDDRANLLARIRHGQNAIVHGAGERLLVGTDSGTPFNFHTDALWREMDLMVQYGIPPTEVLAMATRRNAEYMNMAGLVGTVTAGKLAEVIVVDGNPLLSMRDLRNVVVVVKDGKVLKGAASDALSATSQ